MKGAHSKCWAHPCIKVLTVEELEQQVYLALLAPHAALPPAGCRSAARGLHNTPMCSLWVRAARGATASPGSLRSQWPPHAQAAATLLVRWGIACLEVGGSALDALCCRIVIPGALPTSARRCSLRRGAQHKPTTGHGPHFSTGKYAVSRCSYGCFDFPRHAQIHEYKSVIWRRSSWCGRICPYLSLFVKG